MPPSDYPLSGYLKTAEVKLGIGFMDAEVEQLVAWIAEQFTARCCKVQHLNLSSLPGPKIVARDWVYPITNPVNIGFTSQCEIDLSPSQHISGQQATLSFDQETRTWWLEAKSDKGLEVNASRWAKGENGSVLNGAVIKIDDIEMMVIADTAGLSIHPAYLERAGLCPQKVAQTLSLLSFFHEYPLQDSQLTLSIESIRGGQAGPVCTQNKDTFLLGTIRLEDGVNQRYRKNLVMTLPHNASSPTLWYSSAGEQIPRLRLKRKCFETNYSAKKGARSTPMDKFRAQKFAETLKNGPELHRALRQRPARKEGNARNLFIDLDDELGSPPDCLEKFRTRDGRGFGLRTTASLVKGSLAIEYTGKRVREGLSISAFQMALGGGWVLDARRGKARFINHSCEPNCYAKKVAVKGRTRIGIYTLRDVLHGEELTFNYGTTSGEKIECRCGSRGCTRILYVPSQRRKGQ